MVRRIVFTGGSGRAGLPVVKALIEQGFEVRNIDLVPTPGLGGIQFDPTVYQPAQYIRTTIRNIGSALLIALVLVTVGLLALTYDWRAALIGVLQFRCRSPSRSC